MGALLAPILVIIVINIIIFIWIVVVVIQHARKKVARMNKTISNKQILCMTISISGVLFLFGLTWLFFVFTFSVPGLRETFQILFTIFNSLQGFFVFAFIFFTVEGSGYWKACLSCEMHRSRLIQPSIGSTKKQSTDFSTISRQDKRTSEMLQNVLTTEMKKEQLNTEQLQSSTDTAIELLSMNTSSSVVHENGQDAIGSDESQPGKQTDTKPLKVMVKRYSTKKYKRHQVEEVKVQFYHEDSSSSDEGSYTAAGYDFVELWS